MKRTKQFYSFVSDIKYNDFIENSLKVRDGFSCFANSHMIYEHYKNPLFKNVFSKASFVLPDGVPLLKSVKYFRKINQDRIAGNDVIYSLIKKAQEICDQLSNEKFEIEAVETIEEVVSKVDIISCATLSKAPLVFGKNLKEGQHLDLVGAYKKDMREADDEAVKKFYRAGPAGIRTTKAFSQDCRWDTLDDDRENGCIRSIENAFSTEGGLAVLSGNIAVDGCVVKTAGVSDDN